MPPGRVRTMCPMNCHPTYCGMLVEVGADGRAHRVDGDPDNPDSRGFLCVRGRAAAEIPHNERRLRVPLRRAGARGSGAWREIGWPAALDEIAGQIRATRPDRVGVWFGHGAYVTTIARPLIMRFGHLGGFQVWNPAIVCWALGAYGLALTGVLEANTKEDLAAHSNLVVLWGANLASQPTTAPHLVAARRRGARVVVIDVRRSEAARQADEVYLIRPGTGKIELYSERAAALGLSPVPAFTPRETGSGPARAGLEFRQGRTLTAFHAFYDAGRALPTLARADPEPELWIHPIDAAARALEPGQPIELYNERGAFGARARVTEDVLPGVVWMRDGWPGLNVLTSGSPCLGPEASDGLDPRIPGGQASFEAWVEIRPRGPGPAAPGRPS